MEQADNKYLNTVYNAEKRPFTAYPSLLARHLFERCGMREGRKILDLGCGRGEFLRGFIECGLVGYGVDQGDVAKENCPGAEIRVANLEDRLPYDDASFDYVYSKSVIEHFYYPENLVKEIFRVLRPGGMAVTMTPDWEMVYKWFYEDYTHRTPFTVTSLHDIFTMHGFASVTCGKFLQLPFFWKHPGLIFLSRIIAAITPGSMRGRSKLTRFSKEGMLLCVAGKAGERTTT